MYRREKPLRTIQGNFPTYTSLKALETSPDVAFICSPTSSHMDIAIECASAGCNLFIESLGHNFDSQPIREDFEENCKLQWLIQMRYHPCIKKLKQRTDCGKLTT